VSKDPIAMAIQSRAGDDERRPRYVGRGEVVPRLLAALDAVTCVGRAEVASDRKGDTAANAGTTFRIRHSLPSFDAGAACIRARRHRVSRNRKFRNRLQRRQQCQTEQRKRGEDIRDHRGPRRRGCNGLRVSKGSGSRVRTTGCAALQRVATRSYSGQSGSLATRHKSFDVSRGRAARPATLARRSP
jgi:hypothetical protein